MSNLYKLYAPLGSEFSCPDTEMIPLKTTEKQLSCWHSQLQKVQENFLTLPRMTMHFKKRSPSYRFSAAQRDDLLK